MAEWAILILAIVMSAGAYAFNRRVYESQSLVVWGIAALIMSVGLITYIFSKVQQLGQPWAEQYQMETEG